MGILSRLAGRGHASVPGWEMLERNWRDVEFCVVDLEATGLHLQRDEIVSYGAVIVRGGRMVVNTRLYGLVRPSRPVSEAALLVHALTSAELVDAPGLDACADALAEALRGRVLVAHAAWIERAFIGRAFATRRLRLDGPVVDTAALARELHLAPRRAGSTEPALEQLALDLGLPVHTPHHALGDALTTAELLLAFATRLEAAGPVTVRSLAEITQRRGLY
ncbi:MAG: 3'-5' exonuclease [Kineosporiaceae bacterium]|nr:3'-5' exonuclease [Kineosporiaceae bacterium]